MNKPFEASKTTARDQPALPPNASPTDLEKLETSILSICRQLLRTFDFGVTDNFFDAGGGHAETCGPLRDSNWPEQQQQIQRGDWPPPRQVNPRVPKALDAICREAMARRPELRYLLQ